MTAILVVACVTLLASFLCSILEAALYAITPSQLAVLRESGVRGARRFARFRNDIEEPIAAILTVNTIAHTVGATVCGALVTSYAKDAGMVASTVLGVFTVVFTILVLALTEIVPKSLGVRYAKGLVPYLAWPMQLIVWVSLPLAKLSKMLMRLLTGGGKGGSHALPTSDEIIAMSKIAERGGALSSRELEWVENALRLDQVAARDLMTPRTVVQTLTADRSIGELVASAHAMLHSRFPVCEGSSQDSLVGVVYRRDLFDASSTGRNDGVVRDLLRPIEFVPEGMKGPQLLDKFIRGKRHIVAVIDEYGGFEGIVTLEDVLECLLGAEIVDEHDQHVDMQEYARRKALARVRAQAKTLGRQSET